MSNRFLKYYTIVGIIIIVTAAVILYRSLPDDTRSGIKPDPTVWDVPYLNSLALGAEADLIRYGHELIVNTSKYLGPEGVIAHKSNGMNCENCHLDAGTRLNGNCFAMVYTTYPKYRERSGRNESIEYRINECMERSLNGNGLDSVSKEMRAMKAYINWLGSTVQKGAKLKGMSIPEIPLMDRAASAHNGLNVYVAKCASCHGPNGQGSPNDNGGFTYPPLWGERSFNVSAGILRLSRLAGYIKHNMPYTVTASEPQLADEEAWDVAAFISSQQRPMKFFTTDWPNIKKKPFDFPFAPYTDGFSETQHRYGPFKPIKDQLALQ
jgi:thiosulfate dehydrogenase